MLYTIVILDEKVFAKDASKINKAECVTIFDKIEQLKKDGITHAQVKRLKNYPVADFRLRVGNYRVLFHIHPESQEIVLLRIVHRSCLY